LIDLSPVTALVTSVTGRVVEGRLGNMAAANKLAVLQKVKQEKGVPFWSFSKDLTKQAKCENCEAVTKIAESLGLGMGKPWK
jgi:hypothetical protein